MFFLPPTTKLRQGNVFTPVCHFVHRARGVSATHPQADSPPGQTPPTQCMLGYTPPPCPVHAGIHTPLPSACWDTVNKRSVRILLECILVLKNFPEELIDFILIIIWKEIFIHKRETFCIKTYKWNRTNGVESIWPADLWWQREFFSSWCFKKSFLLKLWPVDDQLSVSPLSVNLSVDQLFHIYL